MAVESVTGCVHLVNCHSQLAVYNVVRETYHLYIPTFVHGDLMACNMHCNEAHNYILVICIKFACILRGTSVQTYMHITSTSVENVVWQPYIEMCCTVSQLHAVVQLL